MPPVIDRDLGLVYELALNTVAAEAWKTRLAQDNMAAAKRHVADYLHWSGRTDADLGDLLLDLLAYTRDKRLQTVTDAVATLNARQEEEEND